MTVLISLVAMAGAVSVMAWFADEEIAAHGQKTPAARSATSKAVGSFTQALPEQISALKEALERCDRSEMENLAERLRSNGQIEAADLVNDWMAYLDQSAEAESRLDQMAEEVQHLNMLCKGGRLNRARRGSD